MKCQILFSRKNITKCRLLKFLPSMQSVNTIFALDIQTSAFGHMVDPSQTLQNDKMSATICEVSTAHTPRKTIKQFLSLQITALVLLTSTHSVRFY